MVWFNEIKIIMKIEATERNLSHIKGLIEKIGKNKSMKDVFYYPTSRKEKSILNSLGISKFIVTSSNEDTFGSFAVEKDFMNGRSFLRVHNNIKPSSWGYEDDFRAFLIDIGDIVEIKNNVLYIRAVHPTKRTHKGVRIISFV